MSYLNAFGGIKVHMTVTLARGATEGDFENQCGELLIGHHRTLLLMALAPWS
jgi:hypothetical protein